MDVWIESCGVDELLEKRSANDFLVKVGGEEEEGGPPAGGWRAAMDEQPSPAKAMRGRAAKTLESVSSNFEFVDKLTLFNLITAQNF